jgi:HK97 gp10 family phage protein
MDTSFDVQGFSELAKKLESMGKQGVKIEDKALIKSAEPILNDAKNTVAFDDRSGDLRKSLKISKVKKSKNGKTVWIGDVDKEVTYSWFIEYGNSKSRPRPFLKPSYDKNKEQVLNNIKKEIVEGIKSAK